MLPILDELRGLTLLSILVRMLLAVFCGSIIGVEREFKRRPAGFRTHILICIGAAMTTLTSEYLLLEMQMTTDIARLGAQVIAGVGFIGAGTIIVTRHQRVKGLTTAAGLWAVAVVGLAIGCGFYEGAVVTTALILTAELVFAKLEYWITRRAPEVNILVEYGEQQCLDELLARFRQRNIKILHMEITRPPQGDKRNASVIFALRLHKKCRVDELLALTTAAEGVVNVEEL